jgi:hypothetical protein
MSTHGAGADIGTQRVDLGPSTLLNKPVEAVKVTAALLLSGIENCLRRPKSLQNGNFCAFAWRLSADSRYSCHFPEAGDSPECAKYPQNAGISLKKWSLSPVEQVVGWRRSADRTRLRAKSLLTWNLTGKRAILMARRHDP